MFRIALIIMWGIVGILLFCTGCRIAITAEKLEASASITQPNYEISPGVEKSYDADSIRD